MHPKDDLFISCSKDKTMALWDIKSNTLTGVVKKIPKTCRATFDYAGNAFALA